MGKMKQVKFSLEAANKKIIEQAIEIADLKKQLAEK